MNIVIRRLVFFGCILLVALGVAIAVYYDATHRQGRAAWRAYEEEARRRGAKLTLPEFVQPPIRDADNFASVPLFTKLVAPPDSGKQTFKLPDGPKNAGFSLIERSQRADLAGWRGRFLKAGWLPADAPENPAEAVLTALDRRDADEWAQLLEAASRPRSRFPVEWGKHFAAEVPHITVLKAAARWNLLRLEAHLAQGKSDGSFDDLLLGLRLARSMEREPALISGLIHVAMLQQAITGLWSGLAVSAWEEEKLARVEQELAAFDVLGSFIFAVNSERGSMNSLFHQLIHDPEALGSIGDIAGKNKSLRTAMKLYPTGWIYDSQLRANRITDVMLAQIDPAQGRYYPSEAVQMASTEHPNNTWERARYLLYYLIMPGYLSSTNVWLHLHTRVQQARVACALERWKRTRGGAYPDSLEALVPALLPELPRDVISGEPLRYRRDAPSRFVLYSVAMNGVDDGGISESPPPDVKPAKPSGRIPAGKQLDWVWSYPPTTLPAP